MPVCSLADRRVQLPSEVKCEIKSPNPPILLVGTCQLVEEGFATKLEAVSESLRKYLQSKSHCLEGMVMKSKEPYRPHVLSSQYKTATT